MESRFLVLLLAGVLSTVGLSGCGRNALTQAADPEQTPVIDPEVERREIDPADIDTEDFEIGVFAGQIAVEDFGTNTIVGGRFAYHITEKFFVELTAGQADTEPTSFERLSGGAQLLTDPEREYSYYNVSMAYNILPGETFLGRNRAMNTSFYLVGGVGKTEFAGDDRFTVNVGAGMRLLPNDWMAVHLDVRDHIYDIDLLGEEKRTHNLEAMVGVTFFF
jgi:outer membrane beta-barrel protein